MVRIISGSYRGRKLKSFTGKEIRPTADRVKEWIFNVIGNIEGFKVLDLFAGTGNLGLESISRGAESVTFVDSSSTALGLLRRNIDELNIEGRTIVKQRDCMEFLKEDCGESFDLIFADPPYDYSDASGLTNSVLSKLAHDGTFIYETASGSDVLVSPAREKSFGETKIMMYGRLI